MNRSMRTYYYAVLGAIGGLIGWQISGLLGLSFITNLYVSEMVVGALVGMSIGLMIGVTEGLMTRNPVHAGRACSIMMNCSPCLAFTHHSPTNIPPTSFCKSLAEWTQMRLYAGWVRNTSTSGSSLLPS